MLSLRKTPHGSSGSMATHRELNAELRGSRTSAGSSMSEFPVVLFILFLVILFPLINLLGVAMGAVSGYLITTQAANAAASSNTFAEGLTSAAQAAQTMSTGGIAEFAKLKPIGGASSSGITLYIEAINAGANQVKIYGPNTAVPPPIDPVNVIYEYEAVGTFNVGPFMAMSGMPFIGNVPGIGVPAPMTFRSKRAVEHAEGLAGPGTLMGTYTLSQAIPANAGSIPGLGMPLPGTNPPPGGGAFWTLVPAVDSGGASGYFLMNFSYMNTTFGWDPAAAGPHAASLTFSGSFLTPSQASTITSQNNYGSGIANGTTTITATNPLENIAQASTGMGAPVGQTLGQGLQAYQGQNFTGLTASQNAAVQQGLNAFIAWANANVPQVQAFTGGSGAGSGTGLGSGFLSVGP